MIHAVRRAGLVVAFIASIASIASMASVTAVAASSIELGGEHYALVISGASGGDVYAQKYDNWRSSFVATLREKFAYTDDHIIVLAERESEGVGKATRDNVRHAAGDLQKRLTKDDQLLVLLIGHGSALDDDDAKFNLVGPDLRATEWAELLAPIAGKLVFIDTTGASFPFLRKIAGRGHVVVTATDSAAQQFETVFAEFFVKAFTDPAADVDSNGRISIWEAFSYASAGVRQWFERRGQLATERPLLDDTGAGIGREAQNPGADGAVARVTYLDPDVPAIPTNDALAALLKRRSELEADLEALKARKSSMPADQYDAALEKLLLELAQISRQIRARS
jgi:hypothetical protein